MKVLTIRRVYFLSKYKAQDIRGAMLSDYRFSTVWGFIGIVIGAVAFLFNYNMVPVTFPGYRFLLAPAMFVLSFFSEETDFIPKMVLFLSGQFLGYFCFAYTLRKVKKKIRD